MSELVAAEGWVRLHVGFRTLAVAASTRSSAATPAIQRSAWSCWVRQQRSPRRTASAASLPSRQQITEVNTMALVELVERRHRRDYVES